MFILQDHLKTLIVRLADKFKRLCFQGLRNACHERSGLLRPKRLLKDIAGINGAALVDNLLRYAQPIKIFYGFLHLLLGEAVHFCDFEGKLFNFFLFQKFINVRSALRTKRNDDDCRTLQSCQLAFCRQINRPPSTWS